MTLGAAVIGAAAPKTSEKPNLIIRNNTIEDNGFGIYLGWGGVWVTEITGNKITNNGEGIRVVNAYTYIRGNVIENNITGIRVTAAHQGKEVTQIRGLVVFDNTIVNNTLYGLENLAPIVVDARGNWWGDIIGPNTHHSDRIIGSVNYEHWLTGPSLSSLPTGKVAHPAGSSVATVVKPPLPQTESAAVTAPRGPLIPQPMLARATDVLISKPTYTIHAVRLAMPQISCVAEGDFNGDGKLDLAVGTKYAREIFLWRGVGTNRFTLVQNFDCGVHAQQLQAVDVNGDGNTDLIAVGGKDEGVAILLGGGNWNFSPPVLLPDLPAGGEISDILPARTPHGEYLFVASPYGNFLSGYRWSSIQSTFQKEFRLTINRPRAITTGDFNGDGLVDIAFIMGDTQIMVLWGTVTGWSETPSLVYRSDKPLEKMASADLDGNGVADFIFVNQAPQLSVILMDKKGALASYASKTTSEGNIAQLIVTDLNGDGNADAILLDAKSGRIRLLLGRGDGTFIAGGEVAGSYSCSTVLLDDLNNDNIVDLIGLDQKNNRIVIFASGG